LFRGLDILKLDKNSTDLCCFLIQFGGLGVLFGRAKPPKVLLIGVGNGFSWGGRCRDWGTIASQVSMLKTHDFKAKSGEL